MSLVSKMLGTKRNIFYNETGQSMNRGDSLANRERGGVGVGTKNQQEILQGLRDLRGVLPEAGAGAGRTGESVCKGAGGMHRMRAV